MKHSTYTAVGSFQGDPDWNIDVKAHGFPTFDKAKEYANNFRILLVDGKLFRDHADGRHPDDGAWHEVADVDVSLSRINQSTRDRVTTAHHGYAERGIDDLGAALDSIKAFETGARHDLMTTMDDFEPVDLPICKWHLETGLTCGFGSLAWAIEKDGLRVTQSTQPSINEAAR